MAYFITDRCIGCSICLKNCPIGAITGTLKVRHVIDQSACIECGACSRMCPKKAIEPEAPKKKLPQIDYKKCTGCSLCIINCVKNNLKISDPEYHGDITTHSVLISEKNCTGCGVCASVCPIKAITMTEVES